MGFGRSNPAVAPTTDAAAPETPTTGRKRARRAKTSAKATQPAHVDSGALATQSAVIDQPSTDPATKKRSFLDLLMMRGQPIHEMSTHRAMRETTPQAQAKRAIEIKEAQKADEERQRKAFEFLASVLNR